jgi:DNA polymerase-3 subunit gamma/tau
MAQVLYRKWRPQSWDQVIGQDHVVRTLRNAVGRERLSHAYLFAGPRGTGKTTTARILAKAANCLAENAADRPDNSCDICLAINSGRFLDLIEIDAASNTSVEDVRDLRDRINFAPNLGRFKVYIIDEVHMLSTAAFNALLKTLEEPPPHAIFVLATTEVHKIPATVLSRCQRHEFRNIPVGHMATYLSQQAEIEGFAVEPEALQLIAKQATGSLRDAVSLLDQLVSIGETVTLTQTRQVLGTAEHEAVRQLVQAMQEGATGAGLGIIGAALDGGIDPRQFARQVVDFLREVLLLKLAGGEATDSATESETSAQELAKSLQLDMLLRAMRAFSQASRGQRSSWQPGLQLELAFLEAADPEAARDEPSGAAETAPAAKTSTTPPSSDQPESTAKASADPISDRAEPAPRTAEVEPAPRATEAEPAPRAAEAEPAPRAPEAEPQSPPQSDPSGSGGSGFQDVLDAWPDLLAKAYQRDPRTQALLNSCKPLGVDAGALVLGFQSDLLRDKMEKGHNLKLVTDALGEVLGNPLGVRCVLLVDWGNDTSAPPPMEEGGMVATAIRDLGAQVVDHQPDAGADPSERDGGVEAT